MKKAKDEQKQPVSLPVPIPESSYEDFFTSFLTRRKKVLIKKIDRILSLKESTSQLNKEQLDLINRESEIRKQIEYYCQVKELYLVAMSKNENESSSWMIPEAKIGGLIALQKTNGKVPLEQRSAAELNTFYEDIYASRDLEKAIEKAKMFTENKNLNSDLNSMIKDLIKEQNEEIQKNLHKISKELTPKSTEKIKLIVHHEVHNVNHHEGHKVVHHEGHKVNHHEGHKKEVVKGSIIVGKIVDYEDSDDFEECPKSNIKTFETNTKVEPEKSVGLYFIPEDEDKGADEWVSVGKTNYSYEGSGRGTERGMGRGRGGRTGNNQDGFKHSDNKNFSHQNVRERKETDTKNKDKDQNELYRKKNDEFKNEKEQNTNRRPYIKKERDNNSRSEYVKKM